jgi:uncharacterized protein (TIGR02145 family)
MRRFVLYRNIICIFFLAFYACEKKEVIAPPTVETASVDQILNASARVGGQVTEDGGADVTDRGIYWGAATHPETTGTKRQIGTGTGIYYDTLSGLTPGAKYYVKAYATNRIGTSFGEETFFATQVNLPTVITSLVTEYTATTATIGGVVTDDGGFKVTLRGVYWGTDPDPRLKGTKLDLDTGKGEFNTTLTGLDRAKMYYVTAFATNIKGTACGNVISFSTVPELPLVGTSSLSNITAYSAKVGGNITSNGGAEITEKGVYWGIAPEPLTTGTKLAMGSGSGSFSEVLENLSPGTIYYVKAYATNSIGTSYGDEKSDTTLGKVPDITTLAYTDLNTYGVTLNTRINANYLNTSVSFEYGTTSTYGSTFISDSIATGGADTVIAVLEDLLPNTTYHYRVAATNELGTVYSADSIFKTYYTGVSGSIADIEGNPYQTIGIGYQEWTTSNLKVTRYSDNTMIQLVASDSIWGTLGTGAYCWYNNNDTANKNLYGAIYNWYTVNTGKLCPVGWHVPTDADISELVSFLKGAGSAGGLLKESGILHWNDPNEGATDTYGFTALPGGKRLADGSFDLMGSEGNWWTATPYSTQNATYFYLLWNFRYSFQSYINKKYGMSVRCVKN